MKRILLVTQAARAIGEFRRPWARALYPRYQALHRRAVAGTVRRLSRGAQVTVLTARELVDPALLPTGTIVRYQDEETYRDRGREDLPDLARLLATAWWPARDTEPALEYRGVWLPDVVAQSRTILMQLEIAEPFGLVRRAVDEVKPELVAVMTGASMLERLARLFAERHGLPVKVAGRRLLAARGYAIAQAALHRREERLRIRSFVDHPRGTPPEASNTAPVLFVTQRPRHHYVIDPLVEAVRAAGADTRVIAGPSDEAELGARLAALTQAGTPSAWLTDYLLRDGALRLARAHRSRLRAAWRRLRRRESFRRALVWDGVSLARPAAPFLRDAMERTALAALLHVEAAHRALDAIRPRGVVVTSNRRFAERSLALVARLRRVPCVLFSGTLLVHGDRSRQFDIADRMLVIGEHLREGVLREEGVDPRRITAVGDPRSNAARMIGRARLRDDVTRDLGVPAGVPLLILVSKYVSLAFSIEEKEALYRTVREAIVRLGQPAVVVKAHPNEDVDLLRRQAAAWGWPDAIVTREYDVQRLFAAADAAIMVTSMAGLEAMALGCPVVAVQTVGKDFEGRSMPAYVTERAVIRVDMGDGPGLAKALGTLLDDGAEREALVARGAAFAARYVHPVDGRLGERVLSAIQEIAADGNVIARKRPS